ncbi:hypothetical protein [Streptomyces sp. NPDC002855]|uniref:hypothetical protein n=1 Tax=Streptomyces sp. NPDC002855 TaxID=3154437 RepID=UPI00331CE8E5
MSSTADPKERYTVANRLGVYKGPGETAAVDSFQAWLNRPQVDATDYIDPSWNQSWNVYALKYWGDWRRARSGRQVVLGVHLVPKDTGTLTAGNNGAYDAQYTQMGEMIRANGLCGSVIRLGYEPNNPGIGPWNGTQNAAGYKSMYQRAHGLLKAKCPTLRFDYNCAVGPSGQASSFDALYPGNAYVDIVGLNIYDVWWQHPGVTAAQRWANTLTTSMGVNDFKAFAASKGKPYSFPEWGLYAPGDDYEGGGDNPYFIDRMAELTAGSEYHAYFDLDWGGGVLDDFPNGKAKFKERFGDKSLYVSTKVRPKRR